LYSHNPLKEFLGLLSKSTIVEHAFIDLSDQGSDLDVNSASESENKAEVNIEEEEDEEEEGYGSDAEMPSSPYRKRSPAKAKLAPARKDSPIVMPTHTSPAKFGSTPTVQEDDSATGVQACLQIRP
jgi:hypothetical protein